MLQLQFRWRGLTGLHCVPVALERVEARWGAEEQQNSYMEPGRFLAARTAFVFAIALEESRWSFESASGRGILLLESHRFLSNNRTLTSACHEFTKC
jgi:hypothetical protein